MKVNIVFAVLHTTCLGFFLFIDLLSFSSCVYLCELLTLSLEISSPGVFGLVQVLQLDNIKI